MSGVLYDKLVEVMKTREKELQRLMTPDDFNIICSRFCMGAKKELARSIFKELEKDGRLKRNGRKFRIIDQAEPQRIDAHGV